MTGSFNWQKEAEAQWNSRAGFWNERSMSMWDNGSRKDIIPFIGNHLESGSRILDIGCGDGYGSWKLHHAGYHVTGIDLSEEMIRRAKERVHNDEISFLQGDAGKLPFNNQSTEAIMAINVLEWTEDPAATIREFHRVLKDGGVLFAGILGPTAGPRMNSYPRLKGEKVICNTMMPWEFQPLADETGLKYKDGFGVYKEDIQTQHQHGLPLELKQALTFMWVFKFVKEGEDNGA
ncbi:class I SAM-dependent methyltransferase [Virgibacillus kekensis]|uniref:Class I SAM-dependent methyltransferase n=1 Tax=Virgibacillus kekensis TaxID=202261 RepID=A0ABV9DQU1_9BACI